MVDFNPKWDHVKCFQPVRVELLCGGAPAGQQQLAAAQTAEYTQQTQEQQQLFNQDEALNNEIQSVYGPIFQKGPSQLGFSQGELNTLNSSAATSVGQSFEAANQTMKENMSTGNTELPSGVTTKAEQGIATAGAAQLSGDQSQILQADYAQGNANFNEATNALLGVGQVFNPEVAQGGVMNNAGTAANTTENDISQENEATFAAVMGAFGGITGAALGNGGAVSKMVNS